MIQIANNVKENFLPFLKNNTGNISQESHLKWLRYYLDFCEKYTFDLIDKKSSMRFIDKLVEKSQTTENINRPILHHDLGFLCGGYVPQVRGN